MIVMVSVMIWGIVNGFGNLVMELSIDEFKVMVQVFVGVFVIWIVLIIVVKMVVFWLYMRIFDVVIFRCIVYGLIGVCVCYGIVFEIVFIMWCNLVLQEWDLVLWGSCKDFKEM